MNIAYYTFIVSVPVKTKTPTAAQHTGGGEESTSPPSPLQPINIDISPSNLYLKFFGTFPRILGSFQSGVMVPVTFMNVIIMTGFERFLIKPRLLLRYLNHHRSTTQKFSPTKYFQGFLQQIIRRFEESFE